jgi:preprotein translocase subunit SecE
MMRRQGQPVEGEAPAAPRDKRQVAPPPRERTGPRQYIREVRGELRKVAWPSRPEVVNSTIIVLFAVTVMTSLIFAIDYGSARVVLFLFKFN